MHIRTVVFAMITVTAVGSNLFGGLSALSFTLFFLVQVLFGYIYPLLLREPSPLEALG
ncbi:MAG: hypothetical protein JEY71_12060 [Sphaerochaeta sp.]|nr:hypothetical protein [Sphaerochaeta sp.]